MEPRTEPTTPPRRSRRFGKIITIILLVLALGVCLWSYWQYFYTYSEGNRFGLLQKFSKRGNLFKTYEGELILSSIRGNANVPIASEKFFFSVKDEAVAQQLMNLQGRSITVRYQQKKKAVFWRGDSNYVVDSVRIDP